MNVLLVFAHPERASFVGALLETAQRELSAAGHSVVVSDLYADGFDAAVGAADFLDRANPDYLNVGAEQAHAAEHRTFAPILQREMDRVAASARAL